MIKADFGFVTLLTDFKRDFCAIPLRFVLNKIEVAVQNKPDDFFARNELCYLLFRIMDVLVTVRPLIAEFVGTAFNVS